MLLELSYQKATKSKKKKIEDRKINNIDRQIEKIEIDREDRQKNKNRNPNYYLLQYSDNIQSDKEKTKLIGGRQQSTIQFNSQYFYKKRKRVS